MFLFRDINIDEKKEIRASIKSIYGASWIKAYKITYKIGFSYPFFGNNLNIYYINLILFLLKGFIISTARIKKVIENNINNMLLVNSYKGFRHKLTLPVRGQRTRTNGQTQKRKRI